jgi:hypothetical protein
MQRHAQRALLRAVAQLPHVKRPVVVHGNSLLPLVDGFSRGIGDLVRQPSVGHQRNASVKLGKLYRIIPDEKAESRRYLRVDESGDDYVYVSIFRLEIPKPLERALARAF